MTGDPTTDFVVKVSASIVTEIFKSVFNGVKEAPEWIKKKYGENDPFGLEGEKYALHVLSKYNNMRILGMSKPVPLNDIYINVKILSEISSITRKSIDELDDLFQRREHKRECKTISGGRLISERDYSMILGKPGAGKTTYLKHLALQAVQGELSIRLIPIFIVLRDWVDSAENLEDFIVDQFKDCQLKNPKLFVTALLTEGKCLVLLDGYDEVGVGSDRTTKEVNKFCDKYSKNKYVLSCRTAANTHVFERFTDVEVADFDRTQIEAFVKKWFGDKRTDGANCWEELCKKENERIMELARTPLLITLICLAYEETLSFPPNRAELYEDSLDALLKKWDSSRSIKRGDLYKNLTIKKKELLFARVASEAFEQEKIFFTKKELTLSIDNFMENLIPDQYRGNGEQVLKAIEAQHGLLVERAHKVYSFSHLTFQEYFTAKYLSESTNRGATRELIESHIFDRRWVEVIILTSTLLPEADDFLLLIRKQISEVELDQATLKVFSVLDTIIKGDAPFPVPVKRAIALRYLLRNINESEFSPEHRSALASCEELVSELFDSYKIYIDKDLSELQTMDFGDYASRKKLDLLLEQIEEELMGSFFGQLDRYLYASQILVRCILAGCYINKKVRVVLLESFLDEPWDCLRVIDVSG